MRLIVEMSHPGDVNFFRHALKILSERGWEFEVVTRGRENVLDVLRAYGFQFKVYGKTAPGLAARAVQVILNDIRLLKIAREFRPDVFLSFGSPYPAQVARIMGKRSIVFTDTETSRIQMKITLPFADAIYTPAVFGINLGRKQVRFTGFKELAYLDPRYFDPAKESLPEEFKAGKYAIIRINAFDAAHDIGLPVSLTLEDWSMITRAVAKYVQPVILSELQLTPELQGYMRRVPPTAFHMIVSNAAVVVSDSCTITSESAILGVPAVFCHPDPSCLKNFDELGKRCGLIIYQRDVDGIIAAAEDILADPTSKRKELSKKRDRLLAGTEDVTEVIVKSVEQWAR